MYHTILSFAVLLSAILFSTQPVVAQIDWGKHESEFRDPPLHLKSRPLWFWNSVPNREETIAQMHGYKESGYAGLGILPAYGDVPDMRFMSEAFLAQYKVAADTAAELGMKLCLYDEYWFPSGSAGGLMKEKYPEHLSKRLDMVDGGEITIPPGGSTASHQPPANSRLVGSVAMNTETFERIALYFDGPKKKLGPGTWKIMDFYCVDDGAGDLVDYLDAESVGKFVELTYKPYQEMLGPYFGTTIDTAFYDEPMMYRVQGGRSWTPKFNTLFKERFGYDPITLYPALWFDIGPETAAARNALFGFRAQLFADGFVKTIVDFLTPYGVQLTGHVDQEEVVNPVGICGDIIKVFEHQPIPGLDQIFKYDRGSKMYKLISSAAYNYDHNLVMTEVYGAEGRIPIDMLYREAMDQAAKGVNLFVPHAVWYDSHPEKVTFQPELSHRDPFYAPELPRYNNYIGRLHGLLQIPGCHVADIAVLYPIESLQAQYHFDGPLDPYIGGIPQEEANYMEVGEILALDVRHDYTFLHPEVLQSRCSLVETEGQSPKIVLDNKINREEFQILILPAMRAIHPKTLQKVQDFYNAGGKIIAMGMLPGSSAELPEKGQTAEEKNQEVQNVIREIFGAGVYYMTVTQEPKILSENTNQSGGRSWWLSTENAGLLAQILDRNVLGFPLDIQWIPDAAYSFPGRDDVGHLTYLHKKIDGKNLYFFANSSDKEIRCSLRLREKPGETAGWWNPHTGTIQAVERKSEAEILLKLKPVESLFLVD